MEGVDCDEEGVKERVAYVVAVIGQEKTRDQTTRRVELVEFVSPLGRPLKKKEKYGNDLRPSSTPSHDA